MEIFTQNCDGLQDALVALGFSLGRERRLSWVLNAKTELVAALIGIKIFKSNSACSQKSRFVCCFFVVLLERVRVLGSSLAGF